MMARTWAAELAWRAEDDLMRWVASSRLNLLRALPDHMGEPHTKRAAERYRTWVGPAITRLRTSSSRR